MNNQPSFIKQCMTFYSYLFALSVLFQCFYVGTETLFGLSGWLAAGLVHSSLSLAIFYRGFFLKRLASRQSRKSGKDAELQHPTSKGWLFVLVWSPLWLSVVGSFITRSLFPLPEQGPSWLMGSWNQEDLMLHFAWSVWIPVVEELVFRKGLMEYVAKSMQRPLRIYLSSLLFAFAHVPWWSIASDLTQGLEPQLQLPIGPLLLGFAAATLYTYTRNVAYCIQLHAACNTSVVAFLAVDPRWFSSLSALYQ